MQLSSGSSTFASVLSGRARRRPDSAHSAASVGKVMRDQPMRRSLALALRIVVFRNNRIHSRFEGAENTEIGLVEYR